MPTILEIVLSNVAIATLLAAIAMAVGRCFRRPPVAYALWMLVLLKLVTPPVLRIPVAFLPERSSAIEISNASLGDTSRSGADSTEPAENLAADLPIVLATPLDNEQLTQAASEPGETEAIALSETSVEPFADAVQGPSIRGPDHMAINLQVADLAIPLPASGSLPWREIMLGVWLFGSVIWLTVVIVRVKRFYREVRRPWPVDPRLQRQADSLARRFGLCRSPVVKLVDATVPPMLWAVRGPPVILLPRPLVARLSPDQRNTLLAHELAHYCRRDHWVRWLEVLVLGIYWWNPVAWLARRELQRAEEQCCDAWVLWALPEDGCAYARAILETVDFLDTDRRLAPALATGFGPTGLLERRFEMILHARPMRRLTTNVNLALVLIGLIVLPISAKGQVAAPPETPTDAKADTPPAPRIQAVLTGESALAPPTVEAVEPLSIISARLTAPVATDASTTPPVDGQNSSEQRLQRLERMVESILGELKDRPTLGEGQRFSRRVSAEPMTSAYGRASRQAAPSLADLKKQRIDIEDQLDQLKDRLNDIDDQIAKLQSVRSRNGFDREKAKAN